MDEFVTTRALPAAELLRRQWNDEFDTAIGGVALSTRENRYAMSLRDSGVSALSAAEHIFDRIAGREALASW